MLQAIIAWLKRSSLLINYTPEPENLPPTNIEEFYLAVLDCIYDDSWRLGDLKQNIDRAMTHRLHAGAWHPDAIYEKSPTEFGLHEEYCRWIKMVDHNCEWFEDAALQLIGILRGYADARAERLPLEEKNKLMRRSNKEVDSKKEEEDYKRFLAEVASGFCGDIRIRPLTQTESSKGYKIEPFDCVVTVEFQSQHWGFTALRGQIGKSSNVVCDGEEISLIGSSNIHQHCINMIRKVAYFAVSDWVKTKRLAELEQQTLIKKSAIEISQATGAYYHDHLLEIHQLTMADELNEQYIVTFYAEEYDVYYPISKLIIRVYKNIYLEKEIEKWRKIGNDNEN